MPNTKIMLDPSLVVAKNSIRYTFDLVNRIKRDYTDYSFYYPRSLLQVTSGLEPTTDSSVIKFFLHNAPPAELGEINEVIKGYPDILSDFGPTPEQVDNYHHIYQMLSDELDYRGELNGRALCNILFEELIFLQEDSWLVSRIKKPVNRFIAAGVVCLQFSIRAVDNLATTAVRRTVKKERDEFITNVDRLRAFGKWIAVGGASAASQLINPVVAAVTVPAAFGYFILLDPKRGTNNQDN